MVDFPDLLQNLNPQQRAAVTTSDGPLLVIAGAGSGKTRVITHRIAWLIRERGVAPWQVFAATFTNKAAEEMRGRVGMLLPGADLARLSISTFHSLCVGILRREAHHIGLTNRFTICDDTDQIALIKDCLTNLEVPANAVRPEEVRNYITSAKIMMLGPKEAQRDLNQEYGPLLSRVYARYQERLMANDAVDFDDLLLHVVHVFQNQPDVIKHYRSRWSYVLVDEYQDTNRVQFELVRLLAADHRNICVVGDEDQSIYSWRGAEIENLLKFSEQFPGAELIRLEQNYRSTEAILRAASEVIRHNSQRMGKDLWSERGLGEPITTFTGLSEREEAALVVETIFWIRNLKGIPFRGMGVFYRVNALSRVLEDQLRVRGIAYRVIGGIKFYDRAEIKDLLAYLRLCVNPRDGVALTRIINKPTRGIGAKSVAKLFAESVKRGVSLWECLLAVRDEKEFDISKKARAGIADLTQRIKDWGEYALDHPPREVLERILRETNYEASLGKGSDLEIMSRRENLGELLSALDEFYAQDPGSDLGMFLERVALVNAQDDLTDEDAVSLMTLHCAKGLEYQVVFIVGMEEPIFPSRRAVTDQGHFEEERRLFYVGITRAKDLLFLSRADSRRLYGRPAYNTPSLFLREVPGDLTRTLEEARHQWSEAASLRDQQMRGPRSDHAHALREPLDLATSAVGVGGGRFAIGERVQHDRLGEGEVVGVSGDGDRRKISVRFDAGLELELLERYGGLEPADESDLPY